MGITSVLVSMTGCAQPNQSSKAQSPLPSQSSQRKKTSSSPVKPIVGGPKSQVLVLGTTHLSQVKKFDQEALGLLLSQIEAWKPDRIAIERDSGLQCDFIIKNKDLFGGGDWTNCFDTTPARQATGLSVLEATLKLEAQAPKDPKHLDAQTRRLRIAHYMAAGEPVSAYLHWLQLKENEKVPDATINAAMTAQLEKLGKRHGEDEVLAAELARRLGHDRVFQVDDSTHVRPLVPHIEQISKAQRRIWDAVDKTPAGQEREQVAAKWEKIHRSPQGVVDFYKMLNEPRQEGIIFASDFGAAVQDDEPGHYGRYYVAGWETRNLRMVANIREIMIDKPGVKVLAIVGQSHKFYYENYLAQMHDIEIIDVDAVLK